MCSPPSRSSSRRWPASAPTPFSAIVAYLELPRALAVSTIIAVVDMVLVTALTTLGAFLYNITATLVGGIHLTLADE